MSLVAKLMIYALPFSTLALFPLILPLYFGFKLLRRIKSTLFTENLHAKVVLITGASSGIGEHLAYEYGKRGARLALAARREDRLQAVAEKAKKLGSPDVAVFRADVSNPQDCKTLVDQTVLHFGQLDHLVNNAGILRTATFQGCDDVSNFAPIMDTNFWGSVHCTHSAIPHLRKSKGKIVVISSIASWLPTPKLSFYNASKAALTTFFETLRVEFGSEIGITIVTPGAIHSEMTSNEFLSEFGLDRTGVESTEVCAKAIVESACRGDRSLIVPSHDIVSFILKIVSPELLEWLLRYHILQKKSTTTKKEA
ncbi:11-beta-hydroxysteroid dehydrogenase A-like [Euphorbia lathyris]|uniref:11-beta-hydroxysteroid dehydrogenase A-like n=1 Tax=Euphorbia lathyris TaxID=212925 RepID=UPI0033133083